MSTLHPRFSTERILPTEDNARRMQQIILQDLEGTLSMDDSEARQIANPDSPKLVEEQLERLTRSRKGLSQASYIGAWLDGELQGVLKLGSWRRADASIYTRSPLIAGAQRLIGKWAPELPGDKRGIHHLSVNPEVDGETAVKILHALADYALAGDDFTVHVPLMPGDIDPAKPVLVERGFQPTGKMGAPIGDVEQELYTYERSDTFESATAYKGSHPRDYRP